MPVTFRKPLIAGLVLVFAIGFSAVLAEDAAAQSRSAYETGIRLAKRRHVSNPRCYAQVFEQYAVLSRYGRWRWPTSGRRTYSIQQVYQQNLFQRCGVA